MISIYIRPYYALSSFLRGANASSPIHISIDSDNLQIKETRRKYRYIAFDESIKYSQLFVNKTTNSASTVSPSPTLLCGIP